MSQYSDKSESIELIILLFDIISIKCKKLNNNLKFLLKVMLETNKEPI